MSFKNIFFKNINIKQIVLKNTFWIFISQTGGRLIRAIIVIYAARTIGAAEFGFFSYGLSLAAILMLFTDLGINTSLFKEAAQKPTELPSYFSTTFITKAVLGIISVAIVIILGPILSKVPETNNLLPFIAAILFLDTIREFGIVFIRITEKMELEALVNIITNIAIMALGILFINADPTAFALSKGYTLGISAGVISVLYIFRHYLKNIFFHFSKDILIKLLKIGLPMTLAGIAGTLMINTDIYLLGFWRTPEEIGFYSAAERPITLIYGMIGILPLAAFPITARFALNQKKQFINAIKKILHISSVASMPITVGGIITAPSIINLLYGHNFLPATRVFQILLLTLLANFSAVTLNYALLLVNKQNAFFRASIIALILNATLDIILIPRFGGIGSAIATLVNQIFLTVMLWQTLRHAIQAGFFPNLNKILLATAIMGIIDLILVTASIPTIVIIAISAAVYAGILLLLGEPIFKEIKSIIYAAKL